MNPEEILRGLEDHGNETVARSTSTSRARRVADRLPRRQAPTLNELVGQPSQRPWRRNLGPPNRASDADNTGNVTTPTTPVPMIP